MNDNYLKILVQCTRFEDFLADVQFIQIPFELFGSLALLDERTRAESRGNSNLFFTETWPTKFYFNYRVSKDNPLADEFRGNRDDVRLRLDLFNPATRDPRSLKKDRGKKQVSILRKVKIHRAENIITISCISYN